MRKQHAARPMLESVEDRLALSAFAAVAPTSHVHADVASLAARHSDASPSQATHHATTNGVRSEAATAHHHTAKTAHHPQHHSSSSSSSLTGSFSNFLKSIGL
jgi:hypothetical protein